MLWKEGRGFAVFLDYSGKSSCGAGIFAVSSAPLALDGRHFAGGTGGFHFLPQMEGNNGAAFALYFVMEHDCSGTGKRSDSGSNPSVSADLPALRFMRYFHMDRICGGAKAASVAAGAGVQSFSAWRMPGAAVSELVFAAPVEFLQPAQLFAARCTGDDSGSFAGAACAPAELEAAPVLLWVSGGDEHSHCNGEPQVRDELFLSGETFCRVAAGVVRDGLWQLPHWPAGTDAADLDRHVWHSGAGSPVENKKTAACKPCLMALQDCCASVLLP